MRYQTSQKKKGIVRKTLSIHNRTDPTSKNKKNEGGGNPMGELMNDRYTIQVVTPNGNLLGSMKVSPLMIGRILGSIDEEYSKNISYYTNQKENTSKHSPKITNT